MGIIAAITPSPPQKHCCVARRKVGWMKMFKFILVKLIIIRIS
jgi:hypothetical protein